MEPTPRRKNIQAAKMNKRVGVYVPSAAGNEMVKSKDKAINKAFKAESRAAIKRAKRGQKLNLPDNLRK